MAFFAAVLFCEDDGFFFREILFQIFQETGNDDADNQHDREGGTDRKGLEKREGGLVEEKGDRENDKDDAPEDPELFTRFFVLTDVLD